jgi:TonB-linked SusC/RagA family outer membrane protein
MMKEKFKKLLQLLRWSSCFFMMLGISLSIHAQEKVVIGTVVDASGAFMPGVNIIVKGKNVAAVSDVNGKFSVKASEEDILVVSFVGYTAQEIKVGNQTTINVSLLEDIKQLNEVVVVGYGVQKKSDLTGAIASVTDDVISKAPVLSADRALQGRAAGVQVMANSGAPGSDISVNIRGIASLNNGAQPLYVIDGVAQSDLKSVAPSDIQSIEILKDASSAAIYGANSGSGVVLVTTKKGKEGKIETNFNYYHGSQSVWKKLDMATGPQYGEMLNEIAITTDKSTKNIPYPNYQNLKTYNFQDAVFRTAPMDNYDFSVSGGSDKAVFMFSGGYIKQDGIVHNSDYNRYSVRLNAEYKSTPWLKIGENISFIKEQHNGFQEWQLKSQYNGVILQALQIEPFVPVYLPSTDTTGHIWGISPKNVTNPQGTIDITNYRNDNYIFNGSVYAIIEPLKGLTFETRISPNMNFNETNNFTPTYYINGNSQQLKSTLDNGYSKTQGWNWQNIATFSRTFAEDYHMTLMGGYEAFYSKYTTIDGQRFDLLNETPEMRYFNTSQNDSSFLLSGYGTEHSGYSYLGRLNLDWKGIFLLTSNFRRDADSKFGPLNRVGNFPSVSGGIKFSEFDFIKNLGFLSFGKIRAGWGSNGKNTLRDYSYYSTVATGTSSSYANLLYPFGGTNNFTTGAAVNSISNQAIHWETIVQSNIGLDLTFLDNRLSLTSDYFERHNDGMIYAVKAAGAVGFTVRTADITTENNGVSPLQLRNIGKISNSGFETTIGWKDTKGKFKYSIDLNYTYVTSKALNLNGDSIAAGTVSGLGTVAITKEGQPVGEFYGYKTNGLYRLQDVDTSGKVVSYYKNGLPVYLTKTAHPGDLKFVDINKDGKLTTADIVPLGNPNPKHLIGFSFNFEYEFIDLSLFFQGTYGNKIFNANKYFYYNLSGNFNWREEYVKNRYILEVKDKNTGEILIKGNDNGTLPALTPNDANQNMARVSDFFIEDGSYLRLKNAQIGFTLPHSLTLKAGISNLRVYFGAQNLLTFTKYSGFDPEVGPAGGSEHDLVSGLDIGNYPQARVYTIGLNVRF